MSKLPPGQRPGRNGGIGLPNGGGGFSSAFDDMSRRRTREAEERASMSSNNNRSSTATDGGGRRFRERRTGGYGGFEGFSMNAAAEKYGDRAPPLPPPQQEEEEEEEVYGRYDNYSDRRGVQRPSSLERSIAHRRSGERLGSGPETSKSRSRSRPSSSRGGGAVAALRNNSIAMGAEGARQIDDVLAYIRSDWDFMTDEKCVPVQVALKLLDTSSLGLAHRQDQFRETHAQLARALKAVVNEHHHGLNSSIGTFHKIQSSLRASQQKVRGLREGLVQAKVNLATTKPELKGFAGTSQNYDDMLQVLAHIEQLQLVPEKLEARISEKRFLTAVDILQDALRIVRKSEMEEIGALSDLRVYLSNQEHSLTDILIEELHSHLYLKSPYCEDRWKIYAQNLNKASESDDHAVDTRGRALYNFLDKLEAADPVTDDAARNPEADSFQYIQLIVEALNRMSRLDIAVDMIEQRLPVELFKVVEKSNNEVAQRHPSTLRAYANKANAPRVSKMDISLDTEETKSAVLNDLLWTLYARFEAIAEGHRVVHDVITSITRREGTGDTSLMRSFKELWKLYQSEIRSLLHDYLATDNDAGFRVGQGAGARGNAFARSQRDKNKRLFKLTDMDTKSTTLATELDDLEFMLKSSVPGLVSDSKRPTDLGSALSSANMTDGSATGHKLLIEPSVFNMGILLPPSLSFLNRLKQVVPPGSDIVVSTLTSFLDDFLVNVFHPQLDETLIDLCAQSFIEMDSFQQDADWMSCSQKPIFKGTTKFFRLITAFCQMLDNLPPDQSNSQLIINQMTFYYEKCSGWYKALISRAQMKGQRGVKLKRSAALAEAGELRDLLDTFADTIDEDMSKKLKQECFLLISRYNEEPLEEGDLIMGHKSISGLCLLYTSMTWLASKVGHLRHIDNLAVDSRHEGGRPKPTRRWTLTAAKAASADGSVYLPMNKETASIFDDVVVSYRRLAAVALYTLHFEVRCRLMHSLHRTLRAAYRLDQLMNEPDPDVVDLNLNIAAIDDVVATQLPQAQRDFVSTGLSLLADAFLVRNAATLLRAMNENGCARMQLNILVLQQNLKNTEPGASLARAAAYFDLFMAGPDAVVERAREYAERRRAGRGGGVSREGDRGAGEFTYEDLKALVELCYSDAAESERREVVMQAKRGMDDHLVQLSEHMWETGQQASAPAPEQGRQVQQGQEVGQHPLPPTPLKDDR